MTKEVKRKPTKGESTNVKKLTLDKALKQFDVKSKNEVPVKMAEAGNTNVRYSGKDQTFYYN